MFKFFHRKNRQPSFRLLWTFDKRNYYFLRNTAWNRLDENSIIMTHPVNGQPVALKDWRLHIFLAANGQLTVTDYLKAVAEQYINEIPDNLDQTIIYELLNMADEKLVVFSRHIQLPAPQFEQPGAEGLL